MGVLQDLKDSLSKRSTSGPTRTRAALQRGTDKATGRKRSRSRRSRSSGGRSKQEEVPKEVVEEQKEVVQPTPVETTEEQIKTAEQTKAAEQQRRLQRAQQIASRTFTNDPLAQRVEVDGFAFSRGEETTTREVRGGSITARSTVEKKPRSVFERLRGNIEEKEDRLLQQEAKRSAKQQTSFGVGAKLLGTGVAKGALETVGLTRSATGIVGSAAIVAGVAQNPVVAAAAVGSAAKGVGESFTRNPTGFVGEVVGSGAVFKAGTKAAEVVVKGVSQTGSIAEAQRIKKGSLVVADDARSLARVEKLPGVEVKATPVKGTIFAAERRELEGVTREALESAPVTGKSRLVSGRELENFADFDFVQANVNTKTRLQPIPGSSRLPSTRGRITTETSTVKVLTPEQANILTQNRFSGNSLTANNLKAPSPVVTEQTGTITFQGFKKPSVETTDVLRKIPLKQKRLYGQQIEFTGGIPFKDTKLLSAPDPVGRVEIIVSGQRKEVLFSEKTGVPIAERNLGSEPQLYKLEKVKVTAGGRVKGTIKTVRDVLKATPVSGNALVTSGGLVLLQKTKKKKKTKTVKQSSQKAEATFLQPATKQSTSANLVSVASKTKSRTFPQRTTVFKRVKAKTRPKTTSATKTSARSRSRTRSRQKVALASASKISTATKITTSTTQASAQATSQSQATASATQSAQKAVSANKFGSLRKSATSTIDKVTPIKPLVAKVPSSNKKKTNEGFVAQVRSRGVFKSIGFDSNLGRLVKKAKFAVDKGSAASTRIIDTSTGQEVKGSRLKKLLGPKFRLSKRDKNVLVEKNTFRIDSGGEKEQITLKGILSSGKRRKKMGFFSKRKEKTPQEVDNEMKDVNKMLAHENKKATLEAKKAKLKKVKFKQSTSGKILAGMNKVAKAAGKEYKSGRKKRDRAFGGSNNMGGNIKL